MAELYPVFKSICLRCQCPTNGFGFYTLYGSLWVRAPGPTLDNSPYMILVHSCGERVHYVCPSTNNVRPTSHDSTDDLSDYSQHMLNVSLGIDYNSRTNRYNARVDKKRLGTHETPEAAEDARQVYIAKKKFAHARPYKPRKKETHPND